MKDPSTTNPKMFAREIKGTDDYWHTNPLLPNPWEVSDEKCSKNKID
jgi:hypothetical protein